ncbi:MAG: group 2 glycosyl transferase [Prevotella sp.]
MILDTTTLIWCGILLTLTIVTPLLNPFFRRLEPRGKKSGEEEVPLPSPAVSIVVIAEDNGYNLSDSLPMLLTQEYAPGYEVIVVSAEGDTATEDILKSHVHNPLLRTTFIPGSPLFMSRKKLAVTLGVKAAANEWIILTDAACIPTSAQWIDGLSRHCVKDAEMVIGYTNYDTDSPAYYRFEQMRTSCYLLRKAARTTAYSANGGNIAFRKSMFISGDGYRGNLEHIQGEYEFLVNKFARNGKTRIATDEPARMTERAITRKGWRNRHLYHLHARKYLKRSAAQTVLQSTDMLAMHTGYLSAIGSGIAGGLLHNWTIAAVASCCLILQLTIRTMIAGKVKKRLEPELKTWKLPFYEIRIPWSNMMHRLRFIMADKRAFTSHKL